MRSHTGGFLVGLIGLLLAAGTGPGPAATGTAAADAVRYEAVASWPALPAGVELGEAAGVAVDAHNHVFVFHRPGRGFDPSASEPLADPAVLEIDGPTGRLIRSWGE